MQVDPIRPTLKAPGTKRFKLDCDELLSTFALKFNLRRYSQETILNLLLRNYLHYNLYDQAEKLRSKVEPGRCCPPRHYTVDDAASIL